MKAKKRYRIWGELPQIGFIEKWKWAYSPAQALKLVRIELEKEYPKIVIPPLLPHCQVEEVKKKLPN